MYLDYSSSIGNDEIATDIGQFVKEGKVHLLWSITIVSETIRDDKYVHVARTHLNQEQSAYKVNNLFTPIAYRNSQIL